ncbi:hypothetical protein HAT2_00031 [Candidatus Similichlamydia laticola]|uniref:Uncharacterized protein n=1 Tax=Candidatus Similichlamydia laticola TaxID=2170265 RepID=A0A369KB71_9BACT|nr:hypothetical protein HAT2_00031 [Candidatus Similichlamydia laticola]
MCHSPSSLRGTCPLNKSSASESVAQKGKKAHSSNLPLITWSALNAERQL